MLLTKTKRDAIRRQYRMLRAAVGKTQIEVAAVVTGASSPGGRYWQIENGQKEPTAQERKALAKVFKVSEDQLPAPFDADEATAS